MDMVKFAAAVCGMPQPRFAMTYCSQCGRETGPGDAGHSSCATHGPQASGFDLSGLIEHAYTTDTGFTLRCYLEHEAAITNGGDAHPDAKERVWLIYAFAGLVDVFELVEQVPGLKDKIEAEALESMKMDQWNVEYDRGEQRAQDRADWSTALKEGGEA